MREVRKFLSVLKVVYTVRFMFGLYKRARAMQTRDSLCFRAPVCLRRLLRRRPPSSIRNSPAASTLNFALRKQLYCFSVVVNDFNFSSIRLIT